MCILLFLIFVNNIGVPVTMKARLSVSLIAILTGLAACDRPHSSASILPSSCRLEAGDVVFRRCSGISSTLVVHNDSDGIFSHVGIVVDSAGYPMIAHAVPDEPDFSGDPDRVKLTAPSRFYESGYAQAGAVCRPANRFVGHRAAQKALELYRRGVLFDHDFDDKDTTRMYCTELVVHAYRAAGVELVDTHRHVVNLPLMHYRCIMPSQVLKSKYLRITQLFNS